MEITLLKFGCVFVLLYCKEINIYLYIFQECIYLFISFLNTNATLISEENKLGGDETRAGGNPRENIS